MQETLQEYHLYANIGHLAEPFIATSEVSCLTMSFYTRKGSINNHHHHAPHQEYISFVGPFFIEDFFQAQKRTFIAQEQVMQFHQGLKSFQMTLLNSSLPY